MQCIRELRSFDRRQVFSLLNDINTVYPCGFEWLDEKFNDILLRKAYGVGLFAAGDLVGLGIETPKGVREVKLSTLKVRADKRNCGVGFVLMNHLKKRWLKNSVDKAIVTVETSNIGTKNYLKKYGNFTTIDTLSNKYKTGSSEDILSCSLEDVNVCPQN